MRVMCRGGAVGKLAPRTRRLLASSTAESYDPIHLGSLDVRGVVTETEHLADFIEEVEVLSFRRIRYRKPPSWRPVIADHQHWAKLPKNLTNSALSGQKGQ